MINNSPYCIYIDIRFTPDMMTNILIYTTFLPLNCQVFSFFQIFQCLEHPAESARITRLNSTLKARRRHFVDRIVNSTDLLNLADLVYLELREYEKLLEDAFEVGLSGTNHHEISDLEKWTFLKSVFFSSTVLTTIGKFKKAIQLLKLPFYVNFIQL